MRKKIPKKNSVMNLGNWLRERRLRAGISQMQLAKALGYKTSQFISNWERGVSEMPSEALPVIAKIYGIDFDYLLDLYVEIRLRSLELEIRSKFET